MTGGQKKRKVAQGRMSRDQAIGFGNQEAACSASLVLEHPFCRYRSAPPGPESHICSLLFRSHTAELAVCFIYYPRM